MYNAKGMMEFDTVLSILFVNYNYLEKNLDS